MLHGGSGRINGVPSKPAFRFVLPVDIVAALTYFPVKNVFHGVPGNPLDGQGGPLTDLLNATADALASMCDEHAEFNRGTISRLRFSEIRGDLRNDLENRRANRGTFIEEWCMAITQEIFEAFLKCHTKAHLIGHGVAVDQSAIDPPLKEVDDTYRHRGSDELRAVVADGQLYIGTPSVQIIRQGGFWMQDGS